MTREFFDAPMLTIAQWGRDIRVTGAITQRFWAKVDRRGPNECWPWLAHVDNKGYGKFGLQGNTEIRAHRLAYELLVGPIPDGLVIDHVRERGCTDRSCVNPAHLEPVTNAENVLRGDGPTAQNARLTHCQRGHELPGANGKRECRACRRLRKQYGCAKNIPDVPLLRVAEAAMVPTHDAQIEARGAIAQPPAPSSGAPKAEPPSARPHSDDDPAGWSHERRPVGESQCPVCHGDQVVPVGPRDWSGQQAVTDCPRCTRPDHVEAPAPRDRPGA